MARKTRLFKSKERKNGADVAEFLRQIAQRIESGEVVLRRGQEELVLKIPKNLILEVQVDDKEKKVKGVQHNLEIELTWFDDDFYTSQLELG
jgi:amphi-Trp domain-containing protein